MRGYLIDNNHIGAIARQEPRVMVRLNKIPPENFPYICTITLGEIEAGDLLTTSTDLLKREEFLTYVYEWFLPKAIEIRATTRIYYAEIMARIYKKYPKPSKRETERHLVELGIDINDVWTAAVAFEHGLIFVTNDKMACIREVLTDSDYIKTPGIVNFEDWLI